MRRFAMGDVSVADMAAAREARAMRQQRLLMQRGALVCLTMNIPGPHKTSPLIAVAFEEGKRLIAQTLPGAALAHELRDKTGFEAYYQAADDPLTVKRALCTVEDTTLLGRLFDIDVLTPAGDKVSREALGLPPRQCFLCGNPAFVCARSRAHSVQAMTAEIDRRILAFYRDRTIAHLSRAGAGGSHYAQAWAGGRAQLRFASRYEPAAAAAQRACAGGLLCAVRGPGL